MSINDSEAYKNYMESLAATPVATIRIPKALRSLSIPGTWKSPFGAVHETPPETPVFVRGESYNRHLPFPGVTLFRLKDAHGMALEEAVDRIMNSAKMVVDWPGFIEAARKQGWHDFMTVEVITNALVNADVPLAIREDIITRCKEYVLVNLLP